MVRNVSVTICLGVEPNFVAARGLAVKTEAARLQFTDDFTVAVSGEPSRSRRAPITFLATSRAISSASAPSPRSSSEVARNKPSGNTSTCTRRADFIPPILTLVRKVACVAAQRNTVSPPGTECIGYFQPLSSERMDLTGNVTQAGNGEHTSQKGRAGCRVL